MLVYVATYPRCGNSWLRLMIALNWRYLTSNGYNEDLEQLIPTLSKYNIGAIPVHEILGKTPSQLEDNLLAYQSPEGGEWRLYLKPGCLSYLDTSTRGFLAEISHKVFVKTHELPPEKPLAGEMAVQMVRHPGAAIHSYFAMERNFGKSRGSYPLLMNIIKGNCNFGSWSSYHEAWSTTTMPLHRISYEDAHHDEMAAAKSVGQFLEFTEPPTKTDFFAARHAAAPLRYPTGSIDAWESKFDPTEMKMLRALHKRVASQFGYRIPFHSDELISEPAPPENE